MYYRRMNVFWFFASIIVVVAGAYWYLNRQNCLSCTAADRISRQKEYCNTLGEKIMRGDEAITYSERLGIFLNGCR